ncbi:MAG: protein-L-isoaspartate(D-aspartate) O-methyltransferase [Thermodesulfovibrionia bacterium]|nr:protein-L-isoaspartate(D-aspartate) O-methyltransferase [Thermodesulfovibrionia bacterium]
MSGDKYYSERMLMVETQLRRRGILDERVLSAMEEIPRHVFVSDDLKYMAYDDCALPIGENQTISQPYMVALMTELLALKGDEKVLEIGTGSGYQTALLSRLASRVFSVERIEALALRAKKVLDELNYGNVKISVSDGTLGLPEEAPYDAIIVTAAAPDIPQAYIGQLKTGGRLVIPVGSRYSQVLQLVEKTSSGITVTESTGCVFVPLLGKDGWG